MQHQYLSRRFPALIAVTCAVLLWGAVPASALVDINSADTVELSTLPGIGDSVAAAIVKHRQENGPFRDISEIKNVKGIGDSLFEKIRSMISVESASGAVDTQPVSVVPQLTLSEVMAKFAHEPTIGQIQEAAVRYAMIYPKEVTAWRRGAKNQALVPDVKFGADWDVDDNEGYSRSNNVDIDEGSVVVGPDDISRDWDKDDNWGFSLDLTWRLSEYVFNTDMLRVRDESEDLVELRQDVVDDVTKLYFDRRRLQVEVELTPPRSLQEALRNELRLQELTANIDALTGGYLSAQLNK